MLVMFLKTLNPKDRRTLVWLTNLLLMTFGTVAVLFKWLAFGTDNPPYPGMVVVLASFVISSYLHRGGSTERAAEALVLLLMAGLFFTGYNTGGFGGPVLMLAPLVPLIAILLIDTTRGMVTLAIVFLILTTYFALHINDAIQPNPNSPTGILVGRYLAVLFSCIAASWVAWGFAETRKQLEIANAEAALTDHLTGVGNRRAIDERLDSEVRRARRSGAWLTFILADVDHFKKYNDVNGHQAGDECLKIVASAISSRVRRPTDFVGRYGGEEFSLILSETDAPGARAIAEIIRQHIIGLAIPYQPDGDEYVSITLGIASVKGDESIRADDLVAAADSALYQGKKEGRNRVVIAERNKPASAE